MGSRSSSGGSNLWPCRGAVCGFGFSLEICSVQEVPGAIYVPACDKFHDDGASGVGLFREFPKLFEHGEGKASKALFVGQVVEGVCIPAEGDGR